MIRTFELFLSRGFTLFGVMIAVPALLSLGSTFSLLSLSGFSLTLIDLYKELLSPVFLLITTPLRILVAPLGIQIPDWVIDLQALSVTGGGIFFRAVNAAEDKRDDPLSLDIREYMDDYGIKRQTNLLYIKTMLLAATGLGLLVVMASLLMIPVTALHYAVSRIRRTKFDLSDIAFQSAFQMTAVLISCVAVLFADYIATLAA